MNLPPVIRQRYFNANGAPLAGGKLYAYQAGTSTPQATYTDSTGVTPNSNPIILDANGEAAMWLDQSLSYKFVLKDSSDVTQWTVDNVIGLLTANSINTASLQDGAVSSAKIADNAVTTAKLQSDASVDANRAVNTNHIRDGVITRTKLASGAVANETVSTQTASFTAATTVDVYLCDATSGAITVTLPAAGGAGASGKVFTFRKINSSTNTVTVDGNASETIDGALTVVLGQQYDSVTMVSDGTNWQVKALDTADYKAVSSSTYSQGVTQSLWAQMTGNSVTLTPGIWILGGLVQYDNNGSTVNYETVRGKFASNNGADNSTEPTSLTVQAGYATRAYDFQNGAATTFIQNRCAIPCAQIRVNITTNSTIYLVPYSSPNSGTWTNARIITHLYAQRIR